MIVSTAAKALLLRGPKYGDSSGRPVIGGQSQGVGWAKEDHTMGGRGEVAESESSQKLVSVTYVANARGGGS